MAMSPLQRLLASSGKKGSASARPASSSYKSMPWVRGRSQSDSAEALLRASSPTPGAVVRLQGQTKLTPTPRKQQSAQDYGMSAEDMVRRAQAQQRDFQQYIADSSAEQTRASAAGETPRVHRSPLAGPMEEPKRVLASTLARERGGGYAKTVQMSQEEYDKLTPNERVIVDFNGALAEATKADQAVAKSGGKADEAYLAEAKALFGEKGVNGVYSPNTVRLLGSLNLDLKGRELTDFRSGGMTIGLDDLQKAQEASAETETKEVPYGRKMYAVGDEKLPGQPERSALEFKNEYITNVSDATARRLQEVIAKGQTLTGGEDLTQSLDDNSADMFDQIYSMTVGYKVDPESGMPLIGDDGKPLREEVTRDDILVTMRERDLDLNAFQTYADRRLRQELVTPIDPGQKAAWDSFSEYLPEIRRILFGQEN